MEIIMGFEEVEETQGWRIREHRHPRDWSHGGSPDKHDQQVNSDGGSVAHEGAVHAGLVIAKRFLLNDERSDCSIGGGRFQEG